MYYSVQTSSAGADILWVEVDPSGRSLTAMTDSNASANLGTIVAVRGSVIDVRFDCDLPPINALLHVGKGRRVVMEVWAQLDAYRVRAIALTPTQGVARGMPVASSGGRSSSGPSVSGWLRSCMTQA
jgi:hypothetical protein